jgi:cytochrome c-type biogenesis protein CcmH/NrfG
MTVSVMMESLQRETIRYTATKDQDSLEQTLIHAERAVEFDPGVAETRVTLGRVRLAAGRYDEAIDKHRPAP